MTVLALETALGRLLSGDCLPALEELARSSDDRFELAYVDPPFNTGKVHGARLGDGARQLGQTAYADAWGGLDGLLAMLEPRLAALARLAGERSSVWLHLDHRAVHEVKVLADRVFGRAAFAGEIIWVPGNGARRRSGPSITHQTILVYAPDGRMIWNAEDPMLREPYAQTSLQMHFSHIDADGRRFRERHIGGKSYRYYADRGRLLGSVWTDCPAMRANTPLVRETTGYPTQKPEKLLERIVRAASRPGGLVLDPMCGSGTTLAVAARLGRRFLGIDRSPLAIEIAERRLRQLEAARATNESTVQA
ncbi:MAG: site-specific DNA-methyltransferase [Pseudomonadota bacterium]|nr:MAG: site-specific DNA-methyltransferase [Pseudomonadota bacterium]